MKYTRKKVIAVDVDGTLMRGATPNTAVVEWCKARKADGFSMTLWSARGEQHARNAAKFCGIEDVFDHILSKPGYILDDKGWSWIKFTKVLKRIVRIEDADV